MACRGEPREATQSGKGYQLRSDPNGTTVDVAKKKGGGVLLSYYSCLGELFTSLKLIFLIKCQLLVVKYVNATSQDNN